jgi:D-3-phosphoglycerate dehydrogenase / 2-oxoglutarate reductase
MTVAKYRVVVTDQVFPNVDVERELLGEIDAELEVASDRDDALQRAKGADALLNTYMSFDADTLQSLDSVKAIARYGIGVDNIDLEAAKANDIVVTNVPDYCVEEVATQAVALILALLRKLPQSHDKVLGGGWGLDGLRPMRRVSELTIGLVGFGRIARNVHSYLAPMGPRFLVSDPFVKEADGVELVELDQVFAESDAISLHAPLLPSTKGMVAKAQLDAMRDDAILVNTSRGPLVVLDDVLEALREGRIGGAGLDVFEVEPPPADKLQGVPNLIASPHTAFYSDAAVKESQTKAATQIIRVLTGGKPDYQVN